MNDENKQKVKVVYNEDDKERIIAPATNPKTKKKRIIMISSISGLALILGIGGGIFMSSYLKDDNAKVEDNISQRNLDDTIIESWGNENELSFKKYNEFILDNKDKNLDELDFSKSFTPVELFHISNNLFIDNDKYMTQSFGNAKSTFNNQEICNCTIKDDSLFFEESISKGSFISLGRRMYENGDKITTYDKGNVMSTEVAKFNKEDKKEISSYKYKEDRGRTPSINGNYIVSEKTVLNKKSVNREIDGTYTLKFDMHPSKSTIMYRTQMKEISSLRSLPKFDYVRITYKVDNKLMPISMHVDEKYYVNANAFANNVENTGKMDTYFYVDNQDGLNIEIPELNSPIDYIHHNDK